MASRRSPPWTQRAASQVSVLQWSLSEMAISIDGRRAAPRHLRVYSNVVVYRSVDSKAVRMKKYAVHKDLWLCSDQVVFKRTR